MPVIDDVGVAVPLIDDWFRRKCNGQWEHHLGISLTTTDNPGWWLTVDELNIGKSELASLLGEVLMCFDAQVTSDNTATRIYAPRLSQCLCATASILKLQDKTDREERSRSE